MSSPYRRAMTKDDFCALFLNARHFSGNSITTPVTEHKAHEFIYDRWEDQPNR